MPPGLLHFATQRYAASHAVRMLSETKGIFIIFVTLKTELTSTLRFDSSGHTRMLHQNRNLLQKEENDPHDLFPSLCQKYPYPPNFRLFEKTTDSRYHFTQLSLYIVEGGGEFVYSKKIIFAV